MQIMTFVDQDTGQVTKVWDGREAMRTLADGLAKLQELEALADNGQAEISAFPMQLPDGSIVATVAVSAYAVSSWRIMMPASAHFTAKNTQGERHRYEIDMLDGAITDPDGNVQLPDGSYVHAVELEPVRLTERLTTEQEK